MNSSLEFQNPEIVLLAKKNQIRGSQKFSGSQKKWTLAKRFLEIGRFGVNSSQPQFGKKMASPNTGYASMPASLSRGKFALSQRTGEFAGTSSIANRWVTLEKKFKMDHKETQHSQGNLKIWFEVAVGKSSSESWKFGK
jgi:hypothetical protein